MTKMLVVSLWGVNSLRASSPIWASEASLARTRELTSLAQIGELARRLGCKLQVLVSLGVFGMKIYNICSFSYRLVLCTKKFTK